MKVVIDDKIPYIRAAAELLFDKVVYLDGSSFKNNADVADADALIIRTRTRCDESLLSGSNVRFVTTATIGFDHIDTAFMRRAGIEWTNCPGCNATSVAQYVRNAVLCLRERSKREIKKVGIVGYGHVGRAVRRELEAIGCEVLLNDPPLQRQMGTRESPFVSLQAVAEQCDVITFHTPLTKDGLFPTFHLANRDFFEQLKQKPIIINSARGGVVDEKALLQAYGDEKVSAMVIDTWEKEPNINLQLLQKAAIATPHIAGYSADGKSNATRMALKAVCKFFGIVIPDEQQFLKLTAAPPLPSHLFPSGDMVTDALLLYNPMEDSRRLKNCPEDFERLRGNYPLRREHWE